MIQFIIQFSHTPFTHFSYIHIFCSQSRSLRVTDPNSYSYKGPKGLFDSKYHGRQYDLGLLNSYRLPAGYMKQKITPKDEATSAGLSSVCLCATLCQQKISFFGFLWNSVLISLQQVFETQQFVKIVPANVVCTLLEGVYKFLPALSIFLAKFCENMFSTNHTLFMGVNENFPSILHSVSHSDIIRYITKHEQQFTEWLGIFFLKIGAVFRIRSLRNIYI